MLKCKKNNTYMFYLYIHLCMHKIYLKDTYGMLSLESITKGEVIKDITFNLWILFQFHFLKMKCIIPVEKKFRLMEITKLKRQEISWLLLGD